MKRRYRLHVKENRDGTLAWRIARVFDTGRQESSFWYDDSAAAISSARYYGL